MFFQSSLFLSFVGLASVLAAPTRQPELEDIQCRCLSFSTSVAPALCTYQELLTLDWETAYSLATTNGFKIQFASESAVTKVLSISKPLPTSILRSIQEETVRPLDPARKVQNEDRIVCGFGEEVEYLGSEQKGLEAERHYIGAILGLFMLLVFLYVLAEHLWTRFVLCSGSIKLEGDERSLTVALQSSIATAPLSISTMNEAG